MGIHRIVCLKSLKHFVSLSVFNASLEGLVTRFIRRVVRVYSR